jgi:hypothetical protein
MHLNMKWALARSHVHSYNTEKMICAPAKTQKCSARRNRVSEWSEWSKVKKRKKPVKGDKSQDIKATVERVRQIKKQFMQNN